MHRFFWSIEISNYIDPVRPWFHTLKSSGEYLGIRFGRIDPNTGSVDWNYKSHQDFDGIGAFAAILREQGVSIESLPTIALPTKFSWISFLRVLPQLLSPRKVLNWSEEVAATSAPHEPTIESPKAVAWHVFSKDETSEIIRISNGAGVTVNSLLLKHLDFAVRPSLDKPSESIPWMIPVNLRGMVMQNTDTGNHSSYVAVKISPHDQVQDVHQSIYKKLQRDEHWASWKAYELTRSLSEPIKQNMIDTNRAMLQWNVGSFSNLGVWDADCEIEHEYCAAPWVFAPPVLKCQMIGAGCITVQGRLGIMLQTHPALTASQEVASAWVRSWVKQIESDIPASIAQNAT